MDRRHEGGAGLTCNPVRQRSCCLRAHPWTSTTSSSSRVAPTYTACSRPQSQDPVCTSLCVVSNERDGWSSATRVAFGGGAGERVARSATTQNIWLNADSNGMQRFGETCKRGRGHGAALPVESALVTTTAVM